MQFVDPRNDVAFKRIFGNDQHTEILISFLNAVMGLSGEREIKHLTILNPYQTPPIEGLKYTLLDIRATDHLDHTFIIEMQVEYVAGFVKRFLYYCSKTYVGQIGIGVDYLKLTPVYFIGVLDFRAFKDENYLTHHLMLNERTGEHEMPGMEFYFIELPKFTKQEHEIETILDKWIFFIKHASDLDVIPASADTAPLKTAYDIANRFRWTVEDLSVYESRNIKIQDERGAIRGAVERREEQIARSMLADGISPEVVMKHTGLSAEQVAGLQTEQ